MCQARAHCSSALRAVIIPLHTHHREINRGRQNQHHQREWLHARALEMGVMPLFGVVSAAAADCHNVILQYLPLSELHSNCNNNMFKIDEK